MRAFISFLFVIVLSAVGQGQVATTPTSSPTPSVPAAQAAAKAPSALPDLPKDAGEIFAAAAPFYDFGSVVLKPWHMKVSYQLFDDKGESASQGSYEYWWASPETYRSTWLRPGVEHTDWHVNGERFESESGEPLNFFERKLQSDLLSPMPKPADLDPEKVRFQREEENFSGVKLPCVMVIRKMPLGHGIQVVPMGMFPTYCFTPEHPILRSYFAYGGTSVIYNKIARLQGMLLPREVTIFAGKRRLLHASVDTVDGISASALELKPRDGLVPTRDVSVGIASGVAVGFLQKRVQPVYPQDAKDARIQGKVVLEATIGTDGRVHELNVLEGPSPSLIASAMVSVSQWEYRPYLLNGVPVEVHTTVNVIYSLGN